MTPELRTALARMNAARERVVLTDDPDDVAELVAATEHVLAVLRPVTTTPPTDAQPGVRRYRRKPVDVEAVQVTGENLDDVISLAASSGVTWIVFDQDRDRYVGQWVVLRPGRPVERVSDTDFRADYEPA